MGRGVGCPGEGGARGGAGCSACCTSVGRGPCCCLEGKESGLRARACGFPPASVRVLECGGGVVGAGAEAVPPAGTRRSLSTQVVASYWPTGGGTELPGRLYLSLMNRLVRPQALGPLGRGGSR